METQMNSTGSSAAKASAKDFFINLGAIVALYTTVVSLLNLLFRVINTAYPQITSNYYSGSQSISFPVSTLIIFFPIFVLLMWLLERGYVTEPEKKHLSIRRWLTYITLFVAGLTLAGDLVTVLYYFIDGQELTTGFLLKILSVFIVILIVFLYYISDIRNKLTPTYRNVWLAISLVIILGSVVWGFSVLGSPRTQQLLKYDQQKVSDLQNINNQIANYYSNKGVLPTTFNDMTGNYLVSILDSQTGNLYGYEKTSDTTYSLCAVFNKASNVPDSGRDYAYPFNQILWNHPAGRYCFPQTVSQNIQNTFPKPIPIQ